MASLGQLSAQLRLEGASPMMAGLRGVGGAASSLAGTLSSLQGPLALLGVSFGAFKSLQGITESLKGIFATGRELQTLSRTTGQSVRDLVVLQKAFGAAGLSADEVPGSLRLLQRALGGVNEEGQPTAGVFARLGLSIQKLKGETAIHQLQDVGTAIQKLPDQASQAAAAMQMFGRSGADMLAVFADPGLLDNMAKSAGGTAEIFQRGAATFAKITTDLNQIGGKTRGFFVGVADQIAPVLLPLLDKLKAIDLVPLGQQAGRAIRIIATAFEQGKAGEIFGASLELGIAKAVNLLVGMMAPAARAFSALFGGQLDALVSSLDPLVDGLAGLLEAGLLQAFENPVRYLQAGVEAALQLSQNLADKAANKPEDAEGLSSMSDHERMALADKYEKAAMVQFDKVRAQAMEAGKSNEQVDDALTHDSSFQELMQYAHRLRAFDPSKYQTRVESIDEIMARHASEPVRIGTDGQGQTIEEIRSDARASLATAPALIAKATGDVAETVRKFFAELRPADVVDEKTASTKLAGLIGQLRGIGDSADGAPVKLGGAAMSFAGNAKATEGDRLARIGGYIGSGGPGIDLARRTAVATERTSQGIQTLLQHYAGADKSQLTARWAA